MSLRLSPSLNQLSKPETLQLRFLYFIIDTTEARYMMKYTMKTALDLKNAISAMTLISAASGRVVLACCVAFCVTTTV